MSVVNVNIEKLVNGVQHILSYIIKLKIKKLIFFVNYKKRDYENLENKKYVIAITGNIGSGKTTVAEILRNFGYSVLDVDIFSKEIIYNERSVKIFLSYLIDKNRKKIRL